MEHNIVDNEERIDSYLCGKMSQEESNEFEKELKENSDLRHQAEAVAQMVMAMKAVGERKDHEFISGIRGQNTNTESDQHERAKVIKPNKSIVYRISIAACIIGIAFGGYRYYDYTVVTSLGKEYANAFPFEDVIRGDSDSTVVSELSMLFENVAQGRDIDSTINELSRLFELSQAGTYNEYTNYEFCIGWNLAMAYLVDYRKNDAKLILSRFTTYENSSAIIEKSSALLNKL